MKKDIQNLFIDELSDMIDAERQIVDALPEMVKVAENPELKEAFKKHLQETRQQVSRLEKIFKQLQTPEKKKVCKAMKGLIQECNEAIRDYQKSPVRDAALISKAQRIEHYEISAYGTLRTFAKELDFDDIADLLQESLDEEGHADKKLTKIAQGGLFTAGVNREAHS